VEAVLDASVAVANCYCLIFQSLKINCNAEGGADFVLKKLALAYVAVIVPLDRT